MPTSAATKLMRKATFRTGPRTLPTDEIEHSTRRTRHITMLIVVAVVLSFRLVPKSDAMARYRQVPGLGRAMG